MRHTLLGFAAAVLVLVALGAQSPAPQSPAPPPPASQTPPSTSGQQPAGTPQQPTSVTTTISSGPNVAPRFAVPQFIALSSDAETVGIAKTITDVLWNDLDFEREFDLIPRDVYATIPTAHSFDDIPFDRWREINADGVIVGTVQKTGNSIQVKARLFNARSREQAWGKEYSGSANARLYAHTIADELHEQQRGLRGVARTRLTFDSDRDGERLRGTVENRSVKELYIADYDGENQRRITATRSLNITPKWSPDARSIAYTSYQRGAPNIFIMNIFQGTREDLTKGVSQNFLPAWSPDGTRVCFMSTRDGNPEIYVANRDGSNLRRLTQNPAIDTTCTWAPNGNQIAFTSDRSGTPQIYLIAADGLGGVQRLTSESYADRPTWSPAPFNEIAYAARTGPGFDIKKIDVASRQVTQLTFGEGSNESPVFSPNGRHLAFMSSRFGKHQILTMARDGKNLRQITKTGNNEEPDWSN